MLRPFQVKILIVLSSLAVNSSFLLSSAIFCQSKFCCCNYALIFSNFLFEHQTEQVEVDRTEFLKWNLAGWRSNDVKRN